MSFQESLSDRFAGKALIWHFYRNAVQDESKCLRLTMRDFGAQHSEKL